MDKEQSNRARSLIWDILILVLIIGAVLFIKVKAIPYIDSVYHFTADTVELGYGFDGLLDTIIHVSPSEWFRTKLYDFDLPSFKWYTALLLAVMVQIVVRDIHSYLDLSWVTKRHFIVRQICLIGISSLFTEFMVVLIKLALLTVCPQNVRLLFLLMEMLMFCLPALIHTIVSKRALFFRDGTTDSVLTRGVPRPRQVPRKLWLQR